MGIRFECPNGHRLHVKEFLAGKRGICPECDARFVVPAASGGRTEAVANGTAEIVSQVEAPAMASPVVAAPVPDIKLSGAVSTSRRSRRSQRLARAKSATFALSAVVFLLLVALVLVLIR